MKVCNRCCETENLSTVLVNKKDAFGCSWKLTLLLCPQCMAKEKGRGEDV